ncbi:DUF2147 domain-containing protein [Flavihumibacter fluvii]|uniref:DUF2147 domain-containing protein n=1 Tax=Flavihumibacter fluvii TaxID=2838157 RepID=UPI001BDF082E|nr:DUF2147 domain-containing protein [Flavihumibacter fluvii]ULQ52057.1 DUF2147 domain-containing protein [Flavihumibacter fluvii]
MKQITCLFLGTIVMVLSAGAQTSAAGDKILGHWLNEEKDGRIEIYKNGNKYFGKLVWGDKIFEADGKTSKKDVHNEDKNLRSRNLLGLVLLTNFTFDDGVWNDGKIYDPKSGKTYSCNIKFKGDKLEIRGYVGISLFGRTTIWTRAN